MRALLLTFLTFFLGAGTTLAQELPFNPGMVPWESVGAQAAHEDTDLRVPLPASQAFRTRVEATDTGMVHVSFTSLPGYYIYLDSISLKGEGMALEGLDKPQGELVDDDTFGLTHVVRGTGTVSSRIASRSAQEGSIHVHFQGCLEGSVCYLPESRTLSVDIPAMVPWQEAPQEAQGAADLHAGHAHTSLAEDQRLASLLGDRHPAVALGIFLGLGILLGLTPCVLPMVPVVLAMVAGANANTRRTAALAGTYVGAHAVVFALLGMGAAWVGSNMMAHFQGAWAILPLAGLMALMGVAMLVGVRIQVPGFIQSWAGSKGEGGSVPGAAVMGGLSSLIIGPCVAPPLAAVVFYLAHEGNPWLGAGAFFALGLGMGVPMLAAALGFKNLLGRMRGMSQWLIKAMGVGLVLLGAWLATRVVPVSTAAWAVAALMGVVAAYWAFCQQEGGKGWAGVPRPAWGYGLGAMLAVGVALAPSSEPTPSAFSHVVASQDLGHALEEAEGKGQTVVVDVHADWCTSCLEMERTTLSSPQVKERIETGDFVPVKVDVTDNSPHDRELLESLGLVGPPAILFFQDGKEARHLRLIGTESEAPFLERLESSQCPLETARQPLQTAAC